MPVDRGKRSDAKADGSPLFVCPGFRQGGAFREFPKKKHCKKQVSAKKRKIFLRHTISKINGGKNIC